MRRMGGEDAGFLCQELAIQPMNPIIVAVLQPAKRADGSSDPITMEGLRAHMAHRLDELPSFRWRILPVPLGLNHPVFIEDPDFELSRHLRHVTLPAPGGEDDLDQLVSRMAEHPLDRSRPMWQMTLVDGFHGGRQIVILAYQHALADGVAALTTFSRVFSGLDHEVATPSTPWRPDPVPGNARLLIDGLRDLGRLLPRLPPLFMKTIRNFMKVRAYRRNALVTAPTPYRDTPVCSLNNSYKVDHSYGRVSLSLGDFRRIKDVAGTSLNDVVLAVVGGAFRRYLIERDDLPERSLTATVPVAFERVGAPVRQYGNRFTGFTTTFATHIQDPWERLSVIAAVTKAAKVELDMAGPELLPDWLEFAIPCVATAIAKQVHRRRRKHPDKPDLVNILVSNLRGPENPWSFGSALIEDLFLSGPPSNGVGSNVMLWSYGEHLNFGINSFADSMQSPRELTGYFHDALDELLAAADAHQNGSPEDRHDKPAL